jgi:hypothetical protein
VVEVVEKEVLRVKGRERRQGKMLPLRLQESQPLVGERGDRGGALCTKLWT